MGWNTKLQLVCGGVKEQASKVFDNLQLLLGSAGATLEYVVQMTVILTDIEHFEDISEIYSKLYFGDCFPAITVFEVENLAHGAEIEISAISLGGALVESEEGPCPCLKPTIDVNQKPARKWKRKRNPSQGLLPIPDTISPMVRAAELTGGAVEVGGMGWQAATAACATLYTPGRRRGCTRSAMGCTSSTHHSNTPTTNQHKSVIDKTENETAKKILKETDSDRKLEIIKITQALPNCDNDKLGEEEESTGTESTIDNQHIMQEESTLSEVHEITKKTDLNVSTEQNKALEDKFSKLEEVVEKVVELNASDINANDSLPLTKLTPEKVNFIESADNSSADELDVNAKEAEEGDPSSPSQSSSSRATRWEALADIAAELPPSLAVDPLTGQIYVLSK